MSAFAAVFVALCFVVNVGLATAQRRQIHRVEPAMAASVAVTAVLTLFWVIVVAVRYA